MNELELWQRLLPLAVGAAASPLLLLGQLAQLSAGGGRLWALRRSLAYLLGALTVVLCWTVAAGWVSQRLPLHQGGQDPVAAAVQLVLALSLVAAALQLWRRSQPPTIVTPTGGSGVLSPLLQGLSLMAINLTSLMLFLPAAQLVGRSGQLWPERVLAWSALDLITLLPVWLPLAVVVVSGRAGERWLDLGGRWIAEHRRAIESGVAAGFALFLACRGLGDL